MPRVSTTTPSGFRLPVVPGSGAFQAGPGNAEREVRSLIFFVVVTLSDPRVSVQVCKIREQAVGGTSALFTGIQIRYRFAGWLPRDLASPESTDQQRRGHGRSLNGQKPGHHRQPALD